MPVRRPDNSRRLVLFRVWIPVVLWMLAIFFFSSLPGGRIPRLFRLQDIVFHAIIYALLGYLFFRALRDTVPQLRPVQLVIITALFVFGYGLSDEFHQLCVPSRQASGLDVFIDTVGGFLGSMLRARKITVNSS